MGVECVQLVFLTANTIVMLKLGVYNCHTSESFEKMKLSRVSFLCANICKIANNSRASIIAFDEVERKPNFDLWLFRVGYPVHGSRPKKTTFL